MDRNLTLSGIALLGVLAWCAPARAQDSTTPDETEAETEHLHLPGYDGELRDGNRSASLELEIAPVLVSHNPLSSGSQTSDSLDLTLTFAAQQRLSDTLELEFDAGASKTIDNGSSSALASAVELRTVPDANGFSAFAGFNVSRAYADFFDEEGPTSGRAVMGLRYGGRIGPTEVGFEIGPRLTESSDDASDHVAVNLWGEAVTPIIGDKVLLIVDASLERRWHEHIDPWFGVRRHDWRFATYGGLDLAGLINGNGGRQWLRDLIVGVEWLKVSSNIPDAERSDLSVLPAVSIGFAF